MTGPEPIPSEADLMQAAFDHYRAGRRAEASALFARVLDLSPDRLGALLMRGIILADGTETGETDVAQAESLFHRCLEVSPENFFALNHLGQIRLNRGERRAAVALFERALANNPGFAPAYNNLGVALHGLGRRQAALAAFERALECDSALVAVHGNRGHVLADLGLHGEAVAAFRQAAASQPDLAEPWRDLAVACRHAGLHDEAEAAGRAAIARDPTDVEAHVELGAILARAGRRAESQAMFATAARLRGTIVEPCVTGERQARILVLCAQGAGNVPTKFLFDHDRFETVTLHLPPPEAGEDMEAAIAALPACDIVFSALGDGDEDDPVMAQVDDLLGRLGLPVLNPPRMIPPTARHRLPETLAGIDNLLVPATRRVERSVLEQLAATLGDEAGAPVLVRPVGSHGGHDFVRVGTASELAGYLGDAPQDEFFVSPYVDFRSPDGYFRKYRFLFVDRKVYAYHLVVHDDWLIHYFRADMDAHPWMKPEEEAFLADYGAAFPAPLARAVQEAAIRLDLDYGGMDCAVTADGRVLVFEANACMLLHLYDSPETFPYKHRYVPPIVGAVGDMVLKRLGRLPP